MATSDPCDDQQYLYSCLDDENAEVRIITFENCAPQGQDVSIPCERLEYKDIPKQESNLLLKCDFDLESVSVVSAEDQTKVVMTSRAGCLRYVLLKNEPLYRTIMISYMAGRDNIHNIHLKMQTSQKALLALNACRKCIYISCYKQTDKLNTFKPLFYGELTMDVVGDCESEEGSVYYGILDQQALILLKDPMSFNPTHVLYFYVKSDTGVVDRMDLVSASGQTGDVPESVNVHTHTCRYTFSAGKSQLTTERPWCLEPKVMHDHSFLAFANALRSIKPSDESIYFSGYTFIRSLGQTVTVRTSPGKAEKQECASAAVRTVERGYFGGDEELALVLNQSVTVETMLGQEAVSPIEEMMEWWNQAKTALEQIISEGLVPQSTIKSTGLDPDSVQHFQQCLDNLSEFMFDQEYGKALSLVSGMKTEFANSNIQAIKMILKMDRVEILRRIYFKV